MTVNKMNDNNNEPSAAEQDKTPAESPLAPPPLKILEDMLHNRIIQKKEEIHKTTQNIADTDRIWIEIETLRLVLSQSLSISRRL
jgi:hypothetical protein